MQMTGGSTSTHGEFDRYRNVGAMAKAHARARGRGAVEDRAGEAARATNGVITLGGKTLTYGELAEAAMKLPPPKTVKLKDPKDWKLIGKPTRRLDTPEKITGKAQFGIDVAVPRPAHRGRRAPAGVRREAREVRRRRRR